MIHKVMRHKPCNTLLRSQFPRLGESCSTRLMPNRGGPVSLVDEVRVRTVLFHSTARVVSSTAGWRADPRTAPVPFAAESLPPRARARRARVGQLQADRERPSGARP